MRPDVLRNSLQLKREDMSAEIPKPDPLGLLTRHESALGARSLLRRFVGGLEVIPSWMIISSGSSNVVLEHLLSIERELGQPPRSR